MKIFMKTSLISVVLLLVFPLYCFTQEYTTDANTVGLWHFNETSSTTVADASGNGNNGTATGTTIVDGKFDKARSFNGTSDNVYIGNPSSVYNLTNQITVEAWIKPAEYLVGSGMHVFSTGQENNFAMTIIPQNKIIVFICNYDIAASLTSASSYIPYQWTHIACTYDGTTIKLYMNGNLDTTMNFSASMNCAQRGGGRNMITIGAYTWFEGTANYFQGDIDEVRISNKARQPYEFNVPGVYGIVAYYPFNGNANDESGNGNNGIVYGATQSTNRFGNGAKAFSFDGATNYIRVPYSTSIAVQNGLTLSAWIYMDGGTGSGAPPRVLEIRGSSAGYNLLNYNNSNISRTFQAVIYNSNNNGLGIFPTSPVPALSWHHILFSANGTLGKWQFFIDGNITDSGSGGQINSMDYGGNDLFIGAEPNLAGKWGGKLDDIRIYNRGVTQTEVDSLYHEGGWGAVSQSTIAAFSGTNGSISPTGSLTINNGATQRYSFTPNSGYCVDSVLVDGINYPDSTSGYTFTNITTNHTLRVTFRTINLQDGLVAYYPFNGNSNDESGNENNGSPQNGVLISADRFNHNNSAYHFDGIDDYIRIPNNISLALPNELTINAWIFSEGCDVPCVQPGYHTIINKRDDQTPSGGYWPWGLSISYISGGTNEEFQKLFSGRRNPSAIADYKFSANPISINTWQMVSVKIRNDTIDFYINGIDAGTLIQSGKVFTIPEINQTVDVLIGWNRRDGYEQFKGMIDDIRLYNRKLSQTEIDSLYHEGGWDATNACAGIPTISYAGKTYNTVSIGDQCWLQENLNIGTVISSGSNQTNNSIIEKYCYNNDTVNCNTYGGLYQWNEAMQYDTSEGAQGICPDGWHIPSNAEFQTLANSVGNNGNALKAVGQGSGAGAGTNTSGFYGLISGLRNLGSFSDLHLSTDFWNSTDYNIPDANFFGLDYNSNTIFFSHWDKEYGFSIRCLKDLQQQTYILHDSVTGNGTITKNPDQPSYIAGSLVVLTAAPDSCYYFVNWSGDTISTQNPITITMNSNKNITANFAINRDTIIASAGSHGSISPSDTVIINCGTNQRFIFTPSSGYHVDSVIVDNIKVDSISGYTFNNVTSNHSIRVTFGINIYTISASAGSNGIITPSGTITANYGVDTTFTITPNNCYHVDSVIVDNIKVDSLSSYTFKNVTANHTIRTTFRIKRDTITAITGTNGAITPSGSVILNCGTTQRFTFSPSSGFYVDTVLIDGVKTDSIQGYTFSDITTNHTIRVVFKEYLSSLSGKVFHDLNGNGLFDTGEPGLLDWQVTCKKSGSSNFDTVTTDANGIYSFSNLPSGKYIMREILQGGWIQTSTNPDTINVASGSTITGNNFGNGHRSSICGIKYEDKNGNGHRDAGEVGLQGWTILLSGTSNASLQTDPSGNYCFTNLLPGYYMVNEAPQSGWKQIQGGYSIQLSSGIDTVCNFGNFKYGSIGGLKFHDLNGDGAMGGTDLGLEGWKIYLEKDGSPFTMKTTSFDGSYSFDSLTYGVYKLTEESRPGWIQTVHPTRNDTVYSGKTFINRNFGNVFGLSMDILAKWNMVSLPIGVLDNRKSIVFPNAISSAFTFEGGYQSKTTLLNGNGYWLKFDSAQTVNLIGDVIAKDTINVSAGWNMIGSISDTISLSCIVPVGTSIQSSYFGYMNGYVSSDVIIPGKAYWVKVSSDGQLILKSCGMFGKVK